MKKKIIYYMGDFVSDKGPAIVNKNYQKYLSKQCYICKTNNKIARVVHFIIHLLNTKILLISGLSKIHLEAMKIAKKLNIKVVYLMHGYNKMEYEINNVPLSERKLEKVESRILKGADKIICVSKIFANYMKKQKKDIANKIDFVSNGVAYVKFEQSNSKKDTYTIISVGGGIRIKNNLDVCRAIEQIDNQKIKFIVIGPKEQDGILISEYSFVEYYEQLPHDEVIKKMQISNLYIQNSYFDTFGLSVTEAIEAGCQVLISKDIGAISILENLKKDMIINENTNINEIKDKIEKAILNCGQKPVINYKKYNWESQSKKLMSKLYEVANEN